MRARNISMEPNHIRYVIKFLSRRKTIRVSLVKDSEVRLFYGPCWVPVWCYVMKLLPYFEEEDAATLEETMKRMVDLARLWTNFPEYWPEKEEEQEFLRIFLQDFVPQVQKFFKVPAKMFYCEEGASSMIMLNENEVLAAFMDFLVQIWNSVANRKSENDMPDPFQRYALVNNELKYLLTFLGDFPFQCCTSNKLDHLLNTLFAEFVTLANQVGHFTLCYISSLQPDRCTEFDADIDALLQIIKVFNNEIIKIYCIKFSGLIPMPVAIIARVVRPIDSLFIIDSLVDDIESLINGRFHVYIDTDEVRLLCKELKLSRKLLKETEIDGLIVVREVAYEAEYLINSYVVGNIPFWYLKLRLPSVIQKLNQSRVHELKSDDNFSHVAEDFTGEKEIPFQPTGTTLPVVEDHLVGIEETKNEILDNLIGIGGSKSLQIISLVGMAGLGKTSLAKYLFDSSSYHFDRRAWSVISQNYVKRKFFLQILMDLISDEEIQELADIEDEELGEKIRKSLYGKRYLIVIDDIWISTAWDDIKKYFPDHNKGSRIMLTSRIKNAAPSESIFPTLTLSQVDSMKLLEKKVFLNEICPPRLLAIGNKVAGRCNGLPLAVMALAGVLANVDPEESVWEKVERDLDKFVLDDDDDQSRCIKVLEFSYEHLPDHLKMCFLYLGTFPEDIKIPIQKILRLWVAEGFIEKVDAKCSEDVAYEYLHDLTNRSLVLISKKKFDGRIKSCRLHDQLRDFCIRKADDKTFLKSTKVPFSTYMRHHIVRVDVSLSSHFGLHRRSFSGPLSTESYSFPQMPLHRVIDLLKNNDVHDRELGGIDMLFHLRYLCASGRELSPRSASNFVNLEFLDILNFRGDGIGFSIILKMAKLKHLTLDESCKCHIIMDCDNSKHPNLQSISTIAVDNLEDEKFLEYCPHLRYLKCHCCQPRLPDLSSCTKLERLKLVMGSSDIIINLVNTILPATIIRLNLSFTSACDAMSIISGLPNLQVLNLYHGCFVEEEWEIKDGKFRKLKVLKLQGTGVLKRWITYREPFPELQCLVLKDCLNLQDISRHLRKITTLQEINVHGCNYILNKSVVQIEEEQYEKGNNKLQIKIIDGYWSKKELVWEYRKLKGAFRLYEENDNLGAAIRSLTGGHCPTEAELKRMKNAVDSSINVQYFLDLIAKIRIPYSEHELQKASQFFDKEALCGDISVSSLSRGLEDIGMWPTRNEIVETANNDYGSRLDYDDFKKLMMTIDVPRPYDLKIALLMAKSKPYGF